MRDEGLQKTILTWGLVALSALLTFKQPGIPLYFVSGFCIIVALVVTIAALKGKL